MHRELVAARRLAVGLLALAGCLGSEPPDAGFADVEALSPVPSLGVGEYLQERRTGAAVGDTDGDGDLDVVVVDPVAIYRNDGHLRLTAVAPDVAFPAGAPTPATCAALADLDNDGDLDLAIAGEGFVRVYANDGDGVFRIADGWEAGGIRDAVGRPTSIILADVSADGLTDIIIPNLALPAQHIRIFSNVGGLRFVQSNQPTAVDGKLSWTALAADLDEDGYLDLYWPDDAIIFGGRAGASDALLRNSGPSDLGEPRWGDAGVEAGVAGGRSTMGIAVVDLDGDQVADLFTSDLHRSYLWTGSVAEHGPIWRPVPIELGELQISWGVRPVDVDLDGDQDLAVVNGNFMSSNATGAGTTARNVLIRNDGTSGFAIEDLSSDGRAQDDRGLASGDFDGDGDVDLLVSPLVGEYRVLENTASAGVGLEVRLVGTFSARDAIGAVVTVQGADRSWKQWLYRGGSPAVESDTALHFGLGNERGPVTVTVTWPSGLEQTVEAVPVGGPVTIEEPRVLALVGRRFPSNAPRTTVGVACAPEGASQVELTARTEVGLRLVAREDGCADVSLEAPAEPGTVVLDLFVDGRRATIHPRLVFD
jgi:hypothetical protein